MWLLTSIALIASIDICASSAAVTAIEAESATKRSLQSTEVTGYLIASSYTAATCNSSQNLYGKSGSALGKIYASDGPKRLLT